MAGPSAGGARPKTTVEHNNNLWLVKFPSAYDKYNMSRIEFVTMKLAKKCGLNVPNIELIKINDHDVFLIQRFDREFDEKQNDFYRTHFVSGLTLMNLDEKDYSNWSYIDLADQMRRWIKKPKNDLHELFKRITFNGLVSNTDDHPRNHGFLCGTNSYHLSPVYDLVPKPETGTTRYLAMRFGLQGRVFNLENLLSQCDAFDLTADEAKNIFNEMKSIISKWHSFYSAEGLSKNDLDYLTNAFSHWQD
jgi:serine/threonine-protein kinase HipA